MKRYGVQAANGLWLEWLTLRAGDDDAAVKWTATLPWSGTEREAKAASMLVPSSEGHPLRVSVLR